MPFQPTYSVPPERQPYTKIGGPVGCLVLHGYMGSPKSTRPLAEFLHQHHISLHCPLLPGHGHWPDKLHRISHRDWLAEAEEALAFLRPQCQEIFIIGHSMGNVLASHLITRQGGIAGLIMLAPVFDVPDKRINWMRYLRYVMPWFNPLRSRSLTRLVKERVHDFDPTVNLDDPAIRGKLPQMVRVPTSSMDEMRRMLDVGRALWPRITIPTLILHGGHDIAAALDGARQIHRLLGSQEKQFQLFPEAGHELMRPQDPAHPQVWQHILQFIQDHSQSPGKTASPLF
ncbi:MAG: alpha/beta fold hydrolase [Chloroflexi bacterium]|nr:alpha/beta fold hydrolase [Chloroflexota bacterium]MBP8058975.1 alpha/beta fold hydrolase [Chloroflexota bacterium]